MTNSQRDCRETLAKQLAKQLKITPCSHNLTGFAEACFNDNSIGDLIEGLAKRRADEYDCKTWGITPTEWRNAIKQALEFRLYCVIENI